ncbi:HAMP domain-containing sensor histidine kinase [Sulfitobacter sp. F26169L]|uniref:sensor histidine kinase n=1 Tax=Sulfitobacter sp. F26169L TaxID=2996015 RepID=UPI002260DD1C|nr:HAMP domain-containing sensor histidine kinase [Sulfitobacter sp. F26169L]MCX7566983.1 HAMP domain-containing sensor histidine kinase [Sulfitobacter sp. F26169L]
MTRTAALPASSSRTPPADETQDIDDFIYLMSHDVRSSVRALLELPQWIAEDLADAGVEMTGSVAQSIDLMNRHTARLDRMLVDLLTYSRVGRMQNVICVDITAAIDEVLGGLHLRDGMQLFRDIECSHIMMGEQDALLLLSALIGNAVKHHHASNGMITVTTRTDGAMIRLGVGDDGPGIPERLHGKALAAMTTLRPRDEVEGTGMGLANVRKIAAQYGGQVMLSTAASGGLLVELLLPHGCDIPA